MDNSRSKRWQAFTQVLLVIGIALAVNAIASIYYDRIDLTADKRYTLSKTTKKMLGELKDVVFVKVYLEGEGLPAGFRKLNEATVDMLEEFRTIAGDKVQYQFISPDDIGDLKDRKDLYKQLAAEGLPPITLEEMEGENKSQRVIVPGAIVTYNNKSMPVVLLQEQSGNISPEESLHNSVIALEYAFANAIQKLGINDKPKIGFIQGHGELLAPQLASVTRELEKYYTVDFVDLPEYKVGRLDPYDAIVIAKPDSFFTELEKYKIDQYLMKGGKILWLVDALNTPVDSLRSLGVTFTHEYNTNLTEDLLFKYGVRINYDMVQDLNCGSIPLTNPNGYRKADVYRWTYYPLTLQQKGHPIVNNLGGVWFRYASSLDTINNRQNPDIHKTILLHTSPYTRTLLNPVRITLEDAYELEKKVPLFKQGEKNLAVLLEGEFNTAFKYRRPSPETLATGAYGEFKERSPHTKMIVVSDGDVIRNDFSSYRQPMELGFDPVTQQMFGNKSFVMNCIDYLIDESGVLSIRAKELSFRPLDRGRVKTERAYWQWVNLGIPVLALGLFGLLFNYIRKRRFANQAI